MKLLLIPIFLLFSSVIFSQDTGMIVGKVLDKNSKNAPLALANIALKGTELKTSSDFSGTFLFEYLKHNTYTLTCSFPGYESKEIDVDLKSGELSEIVIVLDTKKLTLNTASLPNDAQDK